MSTGQSAAPGLNLDDLIQMWNEHKTSREVDASGRVILEIPADGNTPVRVRFPLLGGRIAERLRMRLMKSYAEPVMMAMVGALQAGLIPGLPLVSQSPEYGAAAVSTGIGALAHVPSEDILELKCKLFVHVDRWVPELGMWVKLLALSQDKVTAPEVWGASTPELDIRHIPRPGEMPDLDTGYEAWSVGRIYTTDKILAAVLLENFAGFTGAVLSSSVARLISKIVGTTKLSPGSSTSSPQASSTPTQT